MASADPTPGRSPDQSSTHPDNGADPTGATQPPTQIGVAVGMVFLVHLGLMIVNPLIAPLSRQLHLAEWQIGAVVTVGAGTMVLTSPMWGRRGRDWGRRRVLLGATINGTISIAAFALFVQLGLNGLIGPTLLFVLLLLVRGLWFGLSEAAVLPNVQAYIAETTADAQLRVKGMAALGAAQGSALVAGSALGGVSAAAGPMVPLWTTPILLGVAVVLIAVKFRSQVQTRQQSEESVKVAAGDRRVMPFLLIALGSMMALGFIQMLIGFLVQDRLHTGTERTALLTGIALVCAGVGLVLAQAVIVPKAGWNAPRLIRIGLVVGLAGFALLVPDLGAIWLFVAIFLTGLGTGLITPGVNAGASLAVSDSEQGSVAGLIAATNAITFAVTPLAATALYGVRPAIPLVAAVLAAVISLVVALVHPTLRAVQRLDAPVQGSDDGHR